MPAEERESLLLFALQREFATSLAGKSPKTTATYATGLNRFNAFLTARHGPLETWRPEQLTGTSLEEFYAWLVKAHGRSHRATVVTYLSAARAFVRFLARRALLAPSVSYEQMQSILREAMGRGGYKTPRINRRIPLIVTGVTGLPVPDPQLRKGASRLEVLRDKALILTLFTTGMRREEVARLDRHDLDDGWADRALITGKGDKERVVFFDAATLEAIRAYVNARDDLLQPLFLRHDNRRGRAAGPGGERWRLSPQSIWYIVRQYAKAAGVPASTHHFRHAKASVLLNRGASLSEVQDILGHSSPETTKRIYAHYQVQHLRDAFDRYSATAEELVAELPQHRVAASHDLG
ncbi:MAG: tyrosine-type recombinase/integrase [Chloroflexi bacterium]|nr:tyrosine-type recombinase/integrase [Chloroflexota bacterium]